MAEFLELSIESTSPPIQTQTDPYTDLYEEAPRSLPLPDLTLDTAGIATCLEICVRLDFEDLPSCTLVDRQFEAQGVRFANAIALRPSNAAYRPYSGDIVLMGAPKSGYLEALFLRPAQFVGGFITSSRRTILTAFDRHNQAIARAETPNANLAESDSRYLPNFPVHLSAANIHRVTFHAFDGHLTLDDFCFSLR
jgi:hypothetical protein